MAHPVGDTIDLFADINGLLIRRLYSEGHIVFTLVIDRTFNWFCIKVRLLWLMSWAYVVSTRGNL